MIFRGWWQRIQVLSRCPIYDDPDHCVPAPRPCYWPAAHGSSARLSQWSQYPRLPAITARIQSDGGTMYFGKALIAATPHAWSISVCYRQSAPYWHGLEHKHVVGEAHISDCDARLGVVIG